MALLGVIVFPTPPMTWYHFSEVLVGRGVKQHVIVIPFLLLDTKDIGISLSVLLG
jgi:hypothetical protein